MDHLRFKSEQTAAAYVADGLDPAAREAFELHMMSCPDCVEEVEGWRAIKSCLPRDGRNGRGTPDIHIARDVLAASADESAADARIAREDRGVREDQAARDGQAGGNIRGVRHVQDAPAVEPAAPRASATASTPAARPVSPSQPAAFPPKPTVRATMRWRIAATLAAGVIVGAAGGWYGRSTQGPSIGGDTIGFYSLPPLMRGPSDCTSVRVGPHVDLIALRVPAAAKEQQLVAVDSEGHDLAPDDYSVRAQADGSWLVRLRAQSVREQGIRFEARSADGTVEPRGCVLSAAAAQD